tara:strand:+ start:933 stop:2054 length:1122 start_codon:yes stop_codon:yes gene_type:complete
MKNKIYKYDFLIIGAGLIGAIAALALVKKKFKVLVIDKKNSINKDNRTLAVNANSVDFLKKLGIWNKLKIKPQPINKIVIQDNHNTQDLVFENDKESMGNVIFNKDMHKIAIKKLEKLKILVSGINFNICEVLPNKNLIINKKNYIFKKVIVSIGKNIISNKNHKSVVFDQQHHSHVGFFKHSVNHKNIAYEFFTHEGPLAVLPSPNYNKKSSTFIYSSKEKINKSNIQKLINEKISESHGKLIFDSSIYQYPITPHILKNNKNYIYIGDSLKSIHPVAGQGWNLGIKDIQTLCKLLDQYTIEAKNFNSTYYSRRIVESVVYLSFTSVLNFLYENKSSLNTRIIKFGFNSLVNFKFARDLFIKQAMGRSNLTD